MTVGYLLDTNALSEAPKKFPDKGFIGWLLTTDIAMLYTSCLVLGEIKKGIALSPDAARQDKFTTLLKEIAMTFDGRIIEADQTIALLWGELMALGQKSGKTPPAVDALIAAQCIANNLTLVTRNVKDFKRFSNLELLCPWSE